MTKPKSERQKAIGKLDDAFSKYIRMSAADYNGYVFCFTCRTPHHWKDADCGHFIPRARMATRWEPMNCKPQCKRCNLHRHGERDIFRAELVRIYGKDAIEAMETRARLGGKHGLIQMGALLQDYKAKNKKLREEKGFA